MAKKLIFGSQISVFLSHNLLNYQRISPISEVLNSVFRTDLLVPIPMYLEEYFSPALVNYSTLNFIKTGYRLAILTSEKNRLLNVVLISKTHPIHIEGSAQWP